MRELVLPIIRPRFGALPLASLLLGSLLVERASAEAVVGRCAVRFFGTSTLHDFEGSAPCALLEIDPPDANGEYRVRAEVAVAQLDTGISARDRKMRAMFEAKRFPRITASFERIDPNALRRGSAGAMRISIRGVERSVMPAVSHWAEVADKSARFRARFELSLRDFGMEPPLAMGFIRVDETVKVEVSVELTAKNGDPPAAAN